MQNRPEDRVRRALLEHPGPGAETKARLKRAALGALPPRPPGWLRSRASRRGRLGPLVLVAVLAVGGAALAGGLLHWGPGSSGRTGSFTSQEVKARFERNPALAGAEWLGGPPGPGEPRIDQVPPRASLRFPPGTTYARALQSFYDAVSRRGGLPHGATLGPPLPAGKVLAVPDDPSAGIAIDLRAPFGYAVPSGEIARPSLVSPRGGPVAPPPGPGLFLPAGVRVAPPSLLPCQISRGSQAGPSCRLFALAGPSGARGGTSAVP